jgi:hypothetical protein
MFRHVLGFNQWKWVALSPGIGRPQLEADLSAQFRHAVRDELDHKSLALRLDVAKDKFNVPWSLCLPPAIKKQTCNFPPSTVRLCA